MLQTGALKILPPQVGSRTSRAPGPDAATFQTDSMGTPCVFVDGRGFRSKISSTLGRYGHGHSLPRGGYDGSSSGDREQPNAGPRARIIARSPHGIEASPPTLRGAVAAPRQTRLRHCRRIWSRPATRQPMPSVKHRARSAVVRYAGERQRREFHEALLESDSAKTRPKAAGSDPRGGSEIGRSCGSPDG